MLAFLCGRFGSGLLSRSSLQNRDSMESIVDKSGIDYHALWPFIYFRAAHSRLAANYCQFIIGPPRSRKHGGSILVVDDLLGLRIPPDLPAESHRDIAQVARCRGAVCRFDVRDRRCPVRYAIKKVSPVM